jgi:hypothetical protein
MGIFCIKKSMELIWSIGLLTYRNICFQLSITALRLSPWASISIWAMGSGGNSVERFTIFLNRYKL